MWMIIFHMKEAGCRGDHQSPSGGSQQSLRVAREYDKYSGNIVFRRQREGEHRLRWLMTMKWAGPYRLGNLA